MNVYRTNYFKVRLNCKGAGVYHKVSYPIRYGRYHEIETPAYLFQFNLNGEIKFIQGRGRGSLPPAEWLKRTALNDWIYYSTGGYTGTYSFLGEYYLPNLCYSSNTILGGEPFRRREVQMALAAWHNLADELKSLNPNGCPDKVKEFFQRVVDKDDQGLQLRALEHQRIIQGRVTVLPPDSRHTDYDVIPLIIADGCLHNCGFCSVKSQQDFKPRSRENILLQIEKLKQFYGPDLANYNSVFLGLHDALYADPDLILFAAKNTFTKFALAASGINGPRLFLFGSVASFLSAENDLFEALEQLPYASSINIGMESTDTETLNRIKKPVSRDDVVKSFAKLIRINRSYANIEVSTNFLLSDSLSQNHYASFLKLARDGLERYYSKGAIYLSPFDVKDRQAVLKRFNQLKRLSRLPTYLYLIQRL